MLGMARRSRSCHPSASTSHHTRDQFLLSVGAAAVLTRSCKNFSGSQQLPAPFRASREHRVFSLYLSIHLQLVLFFFFPQKKTTSFSALPHNAHLKLVSCSAKHQSAVPVPSGPRTVTNLVVLEAWPNAVSPDQLQHTWWLLPRGEGHHRTSGPVFSLPSLCSVFSFPLQSPCLILAPPPLETFLPSPPSLFFMSKTHNPICIPLPPNTALP